MTSESNVIFYNCTPYEATIQINQNQIDKDLPSANLSNNYSLGTFSIPIGRTNSANSHELTFATTTELEVQMGRRPSQTYTITIDPEGCPIEETIVIYLFVDSIRVMETSQGKVISVGQDS